MLIANPNISHDYDQTVSQLFLAGHKVEYRDVGNTAQAEEVIAELKKHPTFYDLFIVGDVGRKPDGTTMNTDVTRFVPILQSVTGNKPVIVHANLKQSDKLSFSKAPWAESTHQDGSIPVLDMKSTPKDMVEAVHNLLNPNIAMVR